MDNIDQFISTPRLEQLTHTGAIQRGVNIVDPNFLLRLRKAMRSEREERRGANELTPGQHAKILAVQLSVH